MIDSIHINTTVKFDDNNNQDPTELIAEINSFGFEAGLAVATEAETQASAACGQMSLLNEVE